MTRFDEYCQRQKARYGERFVPPTGREFIRAFNEAPRLRIKVRSVYGDKIHERWGFVGITSGWWRPAFLLMHRIGQRGSSDLLDPARDTIIAERWTP